MSFKFPFTNYHELNLTWVLDQLKKLFEESTENVTTIQNYDGRLTAVETELPAVSETASEASRVAAAAATLAQTAKATADTAQENAIQAQTLAGAARQEVQNAQTAADAATQAAQQAQATAQNFDGRITQAENDASEALEASRSFENRVQAAITTANNAAQTATNAQGIATRADQNAALALDTLSAQRSELERIGAEQVELITEETESGKTEIENLAQSVLDSIPSDYTTLSNLVDKKAPVIINSASGAVSSFNDGEDNMKIQKLVVNIEPVQAGSGDPSPDNIRPITGHTGMNVARTGVNVWDEEWEVGTLNGDQEIPSTTNIRTKNFISVKPSTQYYFCCSSGNTFVTRQFYDRDKHYISGSYAQFSANAVITVPSNAYYMKFYLSGTYGTTYNHDVSINYPATDTAYHPYIGNQISVDWEDEAGTVYGGTITLNPDRTGTLVADRAMVDLGTLAWTVYNGSFLLFYALIPGMRTGNGLDGICSTYPLLIGPDYSWSNLNDKQGVLYYGGGQTRIGVRDSDYLTSVDFAASVAGQTCVYPLAEPQTYPLTTSEISAILTTLYGANNIWANAGPVSVDYPADTKLYIDGKIAELQSTILENI